MAAPPIVDVGGDLTSTSGVVVDTSGGRWVYLWTFSKTGDYDLLWIPLVKIPNAPIAAYIDTIRSGDHKGSWFWIGTGGIGSDDKQGLGQLTDFSCGKVSADTNSPYTFRIVCGPSRMMLSVGLPGSPSPFLTAMYYEDTRRPIAAPETASPPGIANQLAHLATRVLGVPLMFGK